MFIQFFSGDQLKGETDGGKATTTRLARSQPTAAATAATAEEVQEQRWRQELPLATARRDGDDDEPEVAGADVAAAEPSGPVAFPAGK